MAPEVRPQTDPQPVYTDDQPKLALCRIVETHGRAILREPQRLEAMLRDVCPAYRREVFLLVAAVKEQIVADMVVSLDLVPEDLLIARGVRRLSESLGLTEDSARWAIESWVPASRIAAASADVPLKIHVPMPEISSAAESPGGPLLDWRWLGLCGAVLPCAAAAVATVGRMAFYHHWNSMSGWFTETALLLAGLAAADTGLFFIARALRNRAAPKHRVLDPSRSAAALLTEVLVLLVLPLVPVIVVALWAGEWVGELHVEGQAHDLSFQLGRILQSLVLALFLYKWVDLMVAIQGRIASSMVRQR